MRCAALLLFQLMAATTAAAQCSVSGSVRSGGKAVPFATVLVGERGAAADHDGRFMLEGLPCGEVRVKASAVGFRPAQRALRLVPGAAGAVELELDPTVQELEEVVVSGTLQEVAREESPIPVEVVSPRLFRRNPSPALFDAVAMVNGVRPQVNCSVCSTGDIHINGMEGPYTMVLIDGMPIVSGLSTVYGLSGIPTSLIERVEVVKGPGSTLYGSEAMGGIINVITKEPVLAPLIAAEAMATGWGELSGNLGVRLGQRRLTGLLGLDGYAYRDPRDGNGDGFTDLTLQERLSVFTKLALQRPQRRAASLAARLVTEDRWGGQLAWSPRWAGSDSIYGESIATRRWELLGQYQLPVRERVVAQLSWNRHEQRSWYGTTPFNAEQEVLFAQVIWTKRLGPGHELLIGAAHRQTFYDDDTPATAAPDARDAPQRRPVPGMFVQDEWRLSDRHTLLLGHRTDRDRDHGLIHAPRLAFKLAPSGRLAVRASFGTGFRVVSIFTEEHAALTGSRSVVVAGNLLPERSWNGTLNVVRRWYGDHWSLAADASAFLTRFGNRILPDYDTDPDLIIYRNLDGYGNVHGLSASVEARVGRHWRGMAGAVWLQAFTVEQGHRLPQLLTPEWSGTFTIAYDRMPWCGIDFTGRWFGPMRMPVQPEDPRPPFSPWHALANIQVRRGLGSRVEVFLGVKNLLDFVPADPILRPFDPFDRTTDDAVANPHGHTFDTAYMYASMQGRRWFAGLRLTLPGRPPRT